MILWVVASVLMLMVLWNARAMSRSTVRIVIVTAAICVLYLIGGLFGLEEARFGGVPLRVVVALVAAVSCLIALISRRWEAIGVTLLAVLLSATTLASGAFFFLGMGLSEGSIAARLKEAAPALVVMIPLLALQLWHLLIAIWRTPEIAGPQGAV
jgi:hypothetical protein